MAKGLFSNGFANFMLARLSQDQLSNLLPHLKRVELPLRSVIYEPNRPIEFTYFIEAGMVSVISIMDDGVSIEVGTVGKEGLAGACVLFGAKSVPYKHFVQIEGAAHRISANKLKSEIERNTELRNLVLRNQSLFQMQAMQTAACNGLHSVTQRCCRWLLISHDRVESDKVRLTHEFIALMLGVRRSSITEVLRPLQDRGWIESKRGEITILDRAGLESGTCECYQIIAGYQAQLHAENN